MEILASFGGNIQRIKIMIYKLSSVKQLYFYINIHYNLYVQTNNFYITLLKTYLFLQCTHVFDQLNETKGRLIDQICFCDDFQTSSLK